MSTPTNAPVGANLGETNYVPMPVAPSTGPPTEEEVRKFHTNDDVDASLVANHHTLGSAPNQASGGNHTHDGGSSAAISYLDLSEKPGVPMIDYNNLMNLPVLNDYNNLINLPVIPPPTLIDSGQFFIPSVAAGGFYNTAIGFAQAFSGSPAVTAISMGSGRITCSLIDGTLSPYGVTIQANNNTGAASYAGGTYVYWTAVGH